VSDLASIATCAFERLPALPERGYGATVNVEVASDRAVATWAAETKWFEGLRDCAEVAAAQHGAHDHEPGTIEVGFLLTYERWCDLLPTGEAPARGPGSIEVDDIKGARWFALHSAPQGYWLLSCRGPDSWQVVIQGDTVEVRERTSGLASVGRRSEAGYSVADAAGHVVLSAAGPRDRLTWSLRGRVIGEQLRDAPDAGEHGPRDVGASLLAAGESITLQPNGEGWIARGAGFNMSVVRGSAPPAALIPLVLDHLSDVDVELAHRVAAFALLASERE